MTDHSIPQGLIVYLLHHGIQASPGSRPMTDEELRAKVSAAIDQGEGEAEVSIIGVPGFPCRWCGPVPLVCNAHDAPTQIRTHNRYAHAYLN